MFINLIPLLSLFWVGVCPKSGIKRRGRKHDLLPRAVLPPCFPSRSGGESTVRHRARRSSAATDTYRDGSSAWALALKLLHGLGNVGL